MPTKIEKAKHACTDHPFQDGVYGKGIRLFNEIADNKIRCTVCGREQ